MVDVPLTKLLESVTPICTGTSSTSPGRQRNRARQNPAQCSKSLAAASRSRSADPRFHRHFDSLLDFIRAHHIVTIPSDVRPILEETPPFMRATTQASMDTPGPYETHATTAYFNVTLPDPP